MTVDGTVSIDIEDPSLQHPQQQHPLRQRKRQTSTSSSSTLTTNQPKDYDRSRRRRRRKRKQSIEQKITVYIISGAALFIVVLALVWFLSSLHTTTTTTTTTTNDAIDTSSSSHLSKLNSTNNDISSSSPKITHILHTRFMQHQPNLPHLSLSRYSLFESICYRTISSQTTTNFLWIIRTDPNLDSSVKTKMVDLLSPHDNYFLVASNENFMADENDGGWRGGIEGQDLLQLEQEDKIHTGDLELLHEAIQNEEERIVLDTRIDADDGLHKEYMEYVQNRALELFDKKKENSEDLKQKWMYWCVRTNIEWHLSNSLSSSPSNAHPGKLQVDTHSNFCVTPGLTVGYALFTKIDDVPTYPHDVLMKEIVKSGECGSKVGSGKGCIELVDIGAIRSRAATSAGMMGMDEKQNNRKTSNKNFQNKLWEYATHYFSIEESVFQETNDYLSQHVVEIAQDNMKGQCTAGHSCKVSAKENLQRFIDFELENSKLVEVHLK